MVPSKGKPIAAAAIGLGLLTIAAAGYAARDIVIDRWYIHKLGSPDARESRAAAEALIERRSARALPSLIEKALGIDLRDPEGTRYRETFLDGLRKILRERPGDALAVLSRYLGKEHPENAEDLVNTLLRETRISSHLVGWLKAGNPSAFTIAASRLMGLGSAAVPILETGLEWDDPEIRRHAADLLAALQPGPPEPKPAGAVLSTPATFELFGREQSAGTVIFCCDRSGSMIGQKSSLIDKEVIGSISRFTDRLRFAVLLFDTNLVRFPPSGRAVFATEALKAAAAGYLRFSGYGHGSCFRPALLSALKTAEGSPGSRKVIFFISDGFPTCAGNDAAVYGRSTLEAVREANTKSVQINAICIGSPGDINEPFMKELSSANGGWCAPITE